MKFFMKTRIIDIKENPVLGRKEIIVNIDFKGEPTPNRASVLDELKKVLKADKKFIVLREIKTFYGIPSARVKVHVYKDEKVLKETEPSYFLKRMEEKKPKEPPKEEKTEEGGKVAEEKTS